MNLIEYKKRVKVAKDIIDKEIKNSDNSQWRGHLFTKFLEFKAVAKFFCGENVLELGSAEHHLTTKIFSKWSKNLVVVDKIDTFNEKFENCKIIIDDWFNFNSDEKFSDIVFIHGLEHIDDGIELLKRLKSFLNENGRIHIIVPNALSLHRLLGVEMGFLDYPHSFTEADIKAEHKKVYDVFKLKSEIKLAGLYPFYVEGIQLKALTDSFIYEYLGEEYVKAANNINYLLTEYCSEIYILATKEEL